MHSAPKISESQKEMVISLTAEFIRRANALFEREFEKIPVLFDLKGRAAGMYRVRGSERVIRYNPYIFHRYFDDNLSVTIPHEVAHYIIDMIHGIGNVRPHGTEWRALMRCFGADSSRTCSYDMDGLPMKQQRRFTYRCGCASHQLSATRHNRVARGIAQYRCRYCGDELSPVSDGGDNV